MFVCPPARPRHGALLRSLVALGLPALSCGGGDSGAFSDRRGIYMLTALTNNEAGCDAPGPSILAAEPEKFLAGVTISFFGSTMLTLHPCADVADCRTVAADARANNVIPLGSGYVLDGTRGDTLVGSAVVAGGAGATCDGRLTEHVLTQSTDRSITIESRTTLTGPFAQDSDGFCTTEDAKQAAAGKPCTSLRILNAAFVETIE
jgi:hypothetical protein